jgi:hypothetical protein
MRNNHQVRTGSRSRMAWIGLAGALLALGGCYAYPAGYQGSGYYAPGYYAPGYPGSGYDAPGYYAPGYHAPGYYAPGVSPHQAPQAYNTENCGTPDEPKPCPPMPRVPLQYYPANKQ